MDMRERAFTLVEATAVICILTLISTFVWGIYSNLELRKQRLMAHNQMQIVVALLEAYKQRFGDYPQSHVADEYGLRGSLLGQLPPDMRLNERGLVLDPWGMPYRYWHHVGQRAFKLWSCGPDKVSYCVEGNYDAQRLENKDDVIFSYGEA